MTDPWTGGVREVVVVEGEEELQARLKCLAQTVHT